MRKTNQQTFYAYKKDAQTQGYFKSHVWFDYRTEQVLRMNEFFRSILHHPPTEFSFNTKKSKTLFISSYSSAWRKKSEIEIIVKNPSYEVE